jgi:hypothetical protein
MNCGWDDDKVDMDKINDRREKKVVDPLLRRQTEW